MGQTDIKVIRQYQRAMAYDLLILRDPGEAGKHTNVSPNANGLCHPKHF
jgi:hypothetical protein